MEKRLKEIFKVTRTTIPMVIGVISKKSLVIGHSFSQLTLQFQGFIGKKAFTVFF
jgi:hypothetical protein